MLNIKTLYACMLSLATVLMTACSGLEEEGWQGGKDEAEAANGGVFILCEGNFNAGNASLSYYNPETRKVTNGVFHSVNDRKLGDTGQSIALYGNTAYIAVENSGIVWGIDTESFKVKGQLTASKGTNIINPRYVHKVSDTKAYVTDLYAHYINIFNPQTFQYTGSISTEEAASNGYCSTEEMVQWGKYVFVNCWSYSNKILVIDSEQDKVVETITLSSWQPKSMKMDRNGKLWVITDGGYASAGEGFGDNIPHLYRIDAETRNIEKDQALDTDEANVQIAMNGTADTLYIINNDIFRMGIEDESLPSTPFILAPTDKDGKRHMLYGIGVNPHNGEVYVADAVDYRQAGMVYRYAPNGNLIDSFRVGITPNGFAFSEKASEAGNGSTEKEESEEEKRMKRALVSKVFEYMPAPGHQVNGYTYGASFPDGMTMEQACDSVLSLWRIQRMVSLGAQGGYVVAGFDHNVMNSNGDFDLCIKGNPYSYQSEPGIVWVMKDENGDGLPNDTWYELKGSEYGTENETFDYAITYYKPTEAGQDIAWKDNMGGEGIVPYMKAWNTHASYWQDWVPTERDAEGHECHTYYGSRLKDTHSYSNNYTDEPPFPWGYADNLGEDYFKYEAFDKNSAKAYFKLSNAVTRDGEPANLDYINFVKVQTGQTGWSPNLGEISTEVHGIWDVRF